MMAGNGKFERLIAAYRDLTTAERRQLDEHLRASPGAAAVLASFEQMDRQLAALPRSRPGPELKESFYRRLAASARPTVPAALGGRLRWLSTAAGRLAAVGLLLVLVLGSWLLFREQWRPLTEPVTPERPAMTPSPVGATATGVAVLPPLPSPVTPTPAPTASPTATAQAERTLNICLGAEPDTLYLYRGDMYVARVIRQAIYDGPIDTRGYEFQPVILQKLPSLADGDAAVQPVAVGGAIWSWTPPETWSSWPTA